MTAAVRMAYKVAAAQVDRSSRLAQRLRDAGDRAVGPGSDRQALDATERLVFRAMMGGLTWLETAAAERDSPLKRLLAAEYRIVGSMLGLVPTDGSSPPGDPRRTKAQSKLIGLGPRTNMPPPPPTQAARLLTIEHKKGDPHLSSRAHRRVRPRRHSDRPDGTAVLQRHTNQE